MNGKNYTTEADGKIAVRALSGATISGMLVKEGYGNIEINQVMPSTNADVSYTLTVYAEVANTLWFALGNAPFALSGIEVTVDGETKLTDGAGRVKFTRSGNTVRNVKAYGEEVINQSMTWSSNNGSVLLTVNRDDRKSIVTGNQVKPVVDESSM